MLNTQLVRDRFGQYYKIHTNKDKAAANSIKPEMFRSRIQAKRFVDNLIIPIGYWKNIYHTANVTRKPLPNDTRLKNGIAELLKTGKIRIYKIDIPSYADHPPEKRTVSDNKNNKHTFAPATTLLITNPKEVLTFSDKKEATRYLGEISPDKDSLKTLAVELNLPKTQSVNDSGVILDQLATGLASGEIVVVVDRYSAPPVAASNNQSEIHLDKDASNGPEASIVALKYNDEEKEHLCTLNKMTLSCKHGRSVCLDPTSPVDPKTGTAKRLYLAVTSESKSSPKKNYEELTAKIDIKDKCNNHIKSPYFITDDLTQHIGENFGDTIKFYSFCEELNLNTNFYRLIWLPSIKSKSYKVFPPHFCNMSKFEGKAKSIQVDVYPDIKWELNLDIGYGKIQISDSSPDDNKKNKTHIIERKIEQEVFSITGIAKCTHGNETIDFSSNFSNKFDALKQEITGQNALLSKVFGKFQEGDNHSVTLDLPKLSFKGTSSMAEKSNSHDVEVKWDYNIKASPLIGIKAETDILPMLLRNSGWGSLFLPLLRELKEKYANPDGSVGVQLEASITLSIEGKVEFDLNFSDTTFIHDEKSQLRSLKFDVPFKCKGELKGKGHILVFSAELGVLAELNSGFAYEMLMGADSRGIYRSSILHFHGLVFEIKAYIEGKTEAPGKKKTKGDGKLFGNNNNSSKTIKRRKEFSNKWTWIDKKEIEFNKEYIIKDN